MVCSTAPFKVCEPLFVRLAPFAPAVSRGAVQNVSSSPGFLPKSLRTWLAPLPDAKLIVPGMSSVTCLGAFRPLRPARYSLFAVAVAFDPLTVIVHWAVTSLPVFTMSVTDDCLSVVASASYTRMAFTSSALKM